MGDLKDQLFLKFASSALMSAREVLRSKYTPKKSNRFLIKDITYEIGSCRTDSGQFSYEISSKIPRELLPDKIKNEKYFDAVVKLMKKHDKKPDEAKMENIIYAPVAEELKERDYVNLIFNYSEDELYSAKDINDRLNKHREQNIPLPNISGIATPAGKIVLALTEEAMEKFAIDNIENFVAANEEVKKDFKAKAAAKKKATKKK